MALRIGVVCLRKSQSIKTYMPILDVTFVGKLILPEVSTGPIPPPQQPPGIWPPGPGIDHPAHPIAPGGPPPQVWPGPGYPAHPIAPGGPPPHVEHPIAPGGPPPGIWGPTDPRPTPPIYIPIQPPPESGLSPEHPIYIPVYPSHPIELPSEEQKQKLKEFLYGNLPPTPPNAQPVS